MITGSVCLRIQHSELDIFGIAQQARERIETAVRTGDLPLLLANYDDKGMMALAAQHLKNTRLGDFKSWLTRVLRNDKAPALVNAIKRNLPQIQPV